MWENEPELFTREKRQPTKKTEDMNSKNRDEKLRVLSDMSQFFIEMLSYQFNSTDFNEAELAKCL